MTRTLRSGTALSRMAVVGALALLFAAGCDGDNLFSGGSGGGGTPGGGDNPPAAGTDTTAPRVEFRTPADSSTYTRGDTIAVRVHVQDSASGIRTLRLRGISFRGYGDPTSNITEVVKYPVFTVQFPQGPNPRLPLDTTLTRLLLPNSDTVSEPVWLIAEAQDSMGNVAVDTIFLRPGPRVEIIEPVGGTRGGGGMRLYVRAIDPVVGLASLRVELTGAVPLTVVRASLNGTRDPVVIDTMIALPATNDSLTVRATVVNRDDLAASAQPVVVRFTAQTSSDTVAPVVSRELYTHLVGSDTVLRDRIELGETLRVAVRADDGSGSGISRIGTVVRVFRNDPAGTPDTTIVQSIAFATPYPDEVARTFTIDLRDFYPEVGTNFPLDLYFEVHGFALDAATPATNCAASVRETFEARDCAAVAGGGQQAEGLTGQRYRVQAVPGTSVPLPAGSVIADLLPDTTPGRERVFMSNFARNQIEVLPLADSILAPAVLVGSQPWGLFMVPGGTDVDTLMVANSGGTSISFVPTDDLREDSPRRLLTPNDALFEIRESVVNGFIRYGITKLEFSDRPQFVAQDRNKVILYSTQPTSATIEGTIRLALADPTPTIPNDAVRPEVKIIFGREAVVPAGEVYAVARIDSIRVRFSNNGDDQVEICDHRPGRPQEAFCRRGYAYNVLEEMNLMPLDSTDIYFDRGTWRRDVVGFNDTTYVAYSKDLSTVAFGEGHATPYGRIVLYAASASAGTEGSVATQGTADLISNAAERVMGVGLNVDGTFGAARGTGAAYFFSNNAKLEGPLRLQGTFVDTISAGNGGIALHPHHGTIAAGRTATTLAFIATSGRSIRIIDTFHYFEVGEIPLRENVTGQLRAAPPMQGVNTGLTPDRCEYTIAHLYGVSAEGASGTAQERRVLMLNVRTKHLSKDPTRPPCNP